MAVSDSTPPAWSLPAVIVAMGGALVYAYRSSETARIKAEDEKFKMGIASTEAITKSNELLLRVINRLDGERHS